MAPSLVSSSLTNGLTNGHTNGTVDYIDAKAAAPSLPTVPLKPASPDYRVLEQPIGTNRPLRIVCLGAGYSGLMMGIMFHEKLDDATTDLVMYERNSEMGGTWLENRYPGCQCDIPAHNYAFSFEPNPEWPNYYATSEQIHDYMKKTSAKYKTDQYMKFNHEIKSAVWDETEGKWTLKVQHGETIFEDKCDVFVNAGGVLNNWKYPNIKGIGDYQGKLLHSACWDPHYDFQGKRVAVIGIGSSGIQILPHLVPAAKHLTSFVRSEAWISPAPGINEPTENDPEVDEAYNFSPHELRQFKEDPNYLLKHRRDLISRRIANFRRSQADSEDQKKAQILFADSMRARLGDSEKGKMIAEMLTPKFPVGCRRQTPGPRFLEALVEPNVDVRWDDIQEFTEQGILTKSGEELQFDAVVCATGFDTSFQPRFPIIGRDGADLRKQWADVPEAYFGITVPKFPNYFVFIGPNYPISNGSLVLAIQAEAIYIYHCIKKLQTQFYRSLEVTEEATADYNEHVQSYLQRTVWVGGCRSWYKRGSVDGQVVAIYSGTSFHYTEALRYPRWEDYRMDLLPMAGNKRRNRFAYLGNGYTKRETRGGSVGDTQTLNLEDYWKLNVLPPIYD
ncbi:MAG: hypothetical protein M4579_005637 [Chaenotheca gracillima]|nr:MAG: hypothetical protein M4579_005637 [Chaenotheca gracillima]